MTTLHEAPGGTSSEGDFHHDQKPAEQAPLRGISRRKILGGALAAVTAVGLGAAVGVGVSQGRKPKHSTVAEQPYQGGGGAGIAETPRAAESPITFSPERIVMAIQNDPKLSKTVEDFLGGGSLEFVEPGENIDYPFARIRADGGTLEMETLPVGYDTGEGRKLLPWKEASKEPGSLAAQFKDLKGYPDTKVYFFDGNVRLGIPEVRIQGYTGIGTPNERRFSLTTTDVASVQNMSPAERPSAFAGLAGALLQGEAL